MQKTYSHFNLYLKGFLGGLSGAWGNMTELELRDLLQIIAHQQKQLLTQQSKIAGLGMAAKANVDTDVKTGTEVKPGLEKDRWDIIAALAPIISGVVIALCGAYFTTIYNQQQLKLQEIQTIEKFIPHLIGDEKSKKAAILAISSLTDTQLAAKIAAIYASEGTVSALEQIAEHGNSGDRKIASGALARALDSMAENYYIERRYEDATKTYKKALALWEKSYGSQSIKIIPPLLRLAELMEARKDFVEAETFLLRVTEIQKNNYGAESIQLLASLQRLSKLYQSQGLLAKADAVSKQISAIEEKLSANNLLPDQPVRENVSDAKIRDTEMTDFGETKESDLPVGENSQAAEAGLLPSKLSEFTKPADKQAEQLKVPEAASDDIVVLQEGKEPAHSVSSRSHAVVHVD